VEQRHTVLLSVFVVLASLAVIFLWYIWRGPPENKEMSVRDANQNVELNTLSFYIRSISFADTTVNWIPVEFVDKPYTVGGTARVQAILDGDGTKNTFDVIVGSVSGNVQAGSCEYDREKNTFTGNAVWKIEKTKTLMLNIRAGVKGMLRFYTPIQVDSQQKQYYNDLLNRLNKLLADVRDGRQLGSDAVVAPKQICLEK